MKLPNQERLWLKLLFGLELDVNELLLLGFFLGEKISLELFLDGSDQAGMSSPVCPWGQL